MNYRNRIYGYIAIFACAFSTLLFGAVLVGFRDLLSQHVNVGSWALLVVGLVAFVSSAGMFAVFLSVLAVEKVLVPRLDSLTFRTVICLSAIAVIAGSSIKAFPQAFTQEAVGLGMTLIIMGVAMFLLCSIWSIVFRYRQFLPPARSH